MLTWFLILINWKKITNEAKNLSKSIKLKYLSSRNKFKKLQEDQQPEQIQQSLLEDQFPEIKLLKEVICQIWTLVSKEKVKFTLKRGK